MIRVAHTFFAPHSKHVYISEEPRRSWVENIWRIYFLLIWREEEAAERKKMCDISSLSPSSRRRIVKCVVSWLASLQTLFYVFRKMKYIPLIHAESRYGGALKPASYNSRLRWTCGEYGISDLNMSRQRGRHPNTEWEVNETTTEKKIYLNISNVNLISDDRSRPSKSVDRTTTSRRIAV